MKKIVDYIRTKPFWIKCLSIIVFIVIAIAFCTNPHSLIGEHSLRVLIITIPINIILQVISYICISIFFVIIGYKSISDQQKSHRFIAFIIFLVMGVIICYNLIFDNYISVVANRSISQEILLWTDINKDLNDDSDTIVINNATVKLTRYKGHISRSFTSRSLYYLTVADIDADELYRVTITYNDISMLKDREDSIYKIELYRNSKLVKSVQVIGEKKNKENENKITLN